MKRKRKSKGPFVAVPKAIMATPAWRAMSPGGRLLWIELRGWLRNDGLNNGRMFLPAAPQQRQSAPTPKVRLCAGMPKTSTTDSCARPARDFSAWMDAESQRIIASPILLTARIRRPETSRNGMVSRSSTPPAGAAAKNRIPYLPWGHRVPTMGTYGRPDMEAPYVPTMGT
jgi:hypothetical protein